MDTNCIYDVDEQRPDAAAILRFVDMHVAGTASVAVVAIAASERQKGGKAIENFAAFRERLSKLGLGQLEILKPMGYYDVTFFDESLFCGPEMVALERAIHEILFPDFPFLSKDLECIARDPDHAKTLKVKWRNRKCDVQTIWSHIHAGRDVFVSSDPNFHKASKKTKLVDLGAKQIVYPRDV
jgi:hypothetical protein